MAQAPKPGVSKRKERDASAQQVLEMTIRGEKKVLNINNMALQERLICRKATGLPVDAFVGNDRFGLDSLQICWWLARRGEGDIFLTLEKAIEQGPSGDGKTDWAVSGEDIEVEMVTPDEEDDSPEE